MDPSSLSPYQSPLKDSSMPSPPRRKRSFRVFNESSTLLRTRGYLIPLPATVNPIPELLEQRSTTPPSLPRPNSFKKMFRRKPKQHLSRLPSMEPRVPPRSSNNHPPDTSSPSDVIVHVLSAPNTPVETSTTPSLQHSPEGCTVPIDLFYTNEFRTTLNSTVMLSGWRVHDADLSFLCSLQLSCSNPSQHLLHIHVNECSELTDAGLASLGALPSLRTLHCRSCPQLHGHGLFAFASSASLADLDLSSNPWVHDSVFAFVVRSFPRLQSLRLAHCSQVTNQGMYALADRPHHSFSPLLQLDVSGCVKLTDSGLLVILTHCPKLEHLSAAHLPALEGLTAYAVLPQQRLSPSLLSHIDLSHTKSLHFSVVPTIAKGCGRRLTRLNLTNTHGVADAGLVALGRHCPNLEVLTLHGCCDVSDTGVVHLVQYVPVVNPHDADFELHPTTTRCTQLRALDLTGCVLVTTIGIVAVATNCPYLATVALHGVPHIDSAAHHELAARCRRLVDVGAMGMLVRKSQAGSSDHTNTFAAPKLSPATLRALVVHSTATCLNFTKSATEPSHVAAALHAAAAAARQFKELHLGSLVTDDVCAALVQCFTATPACQIRTLDLSRSRHFSTASLQSVLRLSPQLKTLNVEHCDQLTNDVFVDLARCCCHLEHLNVAGNVYMSDDGVRCLEPEGTCPRLMTLTTKGCPNVTKAGLAAVAATHPRSQVGPGGLETKPFDIGGFLARRRAVQQAACKVIAWMRMCLQRYREHELRRRLLWTRLNFRAQCARRIQRRVRAIQAAAVDAARARQAALDRAIRQDAAVRVLVRYLRVFMLRTWIRRQVDAKRAADAFDAAVRKRFVENGATTAIQRAYRYYRGRLVTLQWHARLETYAALRHRRAVQVQRVYRGHRGRVAARALLEVEQATLFDYICRGYELMLASLTVQRAARGYVGRRRASARRAYLSDIARIRNASAHVIQRAFRAYFAKIALKRHLFSNATTIQAVVRGCWGRREAATYILDQRYASPVVLCLLATRSIFQLKLAQPWQAKRNAGMAAATSMQRVWRGYLGRVKANGRRGEQLHRMYMEDVSARMLQRFFAHIRARRRLDRFRAYMAHRHASATKIQATFRMWKGKVKAYALFLGRQRKWKHHAIRYLYYQGVTNPASATWSHWRLVQEGAMHVLVQFYRASLRARGWMSPSFIRHRYQRAAHIQAWVRGFLTRRAVRQYAAKMDGAARCVQRGWHRKVEWKKWRRVVEGMREKKRRQDEEDRATGIAKTRMKQFANDMLARQAKSAIVLQRTYRTWRQRHVFKKVRDARVTQWKAEGGAKLDAHMSKSCSHPVFRAQVWSDTMAKVAKVSQELVIDADKEIGYDEIVAKTTELMPLNLDEEIDLLEAELKQLTDECHKEYATYEELAAEEAEIDEHVGYFNKVRVSPQLKRERESALQSLAPFVTQGKRLVVDTTRLANENSRLNHELIRLGQMRRAFYEFASDRLSFDPLLYELDIDRMLQALEPQWQPNSMHLKDAVLATVASRMTANDAHDQRA